jgi:medium-chain acyl-[acyl-carrier-protein] hydrolase
MGILEGQASTKGLADAGADTIEAGVTVLEQQSASPWFIRFRFKNAAQVKIRLFCFHYAGASASIFRSWDGALSDEIELVAVQLPGREYRLDELLLTDMPGIAGLITEILPLDKPFVFFGHSMGALIEFEVARLLREQGLRQPEMLIASGRNAPQFKWRDAGMQLLPDDEFVAAVIAYKGIPESLLENPALRDLLLPRIRADLTVSAEYQYVEKDPLECPIVVMSGNQDGLSTEAGLNGWLTQTTAEVRYFRFAGNHFFLHSAEQLVLSRIAEELTKLMLTNQSVVRA